MSCQIFELMKWYDWASIALIYSMGLWKMIDLASAAGKWAERKIESDRAKRDAELMEAFEQYKKSLEERMKL